MLTIRNQDQQNIINIDDFANYARLDCDEGGLDLYLDAAIDVVQKRMNRALIPIEVKYSFSGERAIPFSPVKRVKYLRHYISGACGDFISYGNGNYAVKNDFICVRKIDRKCCGWYEILYIPEMIGLNPAVKLIILKIATAMHGGIEYINILNELKPYESRKTIRNFKRQGAFY